jgi:filamin
LSEENGVFFVEFVPQDVGTYIMDVFSSGQKLSDSPVFYKVYDATLIRITEAGSGVVGQPCQFKVDASQAVSTYIIDKI